MHVPAAVIVSLALVAGSAVPAAAQALPAGRQLQLAFDPDGLVTLRAHNVTVREILAEWARQAEIAAALCTQKDLVKIGLDLLGDKPLYAVRVGLHFLAGQSDLEGKLEAMLAGDRSTMDH